MAERDALVGTNARAGVVRPAVAQRVGHPRDGRLVERKTMAKGEDPRDATHAGYRSAVAAWVRSTTTNGRPRDGGRWPDRSGPGVQVHLQQLQTIPRERLQHRIG